MNKVSAISILLISATFLTSCGGKYRVESENQFRKTPTLAQLEIELDTNTSQNETEIVIVDEIIPGAIEQEIVEEETKRPEYNTVEKLSSDVLDYIYEQSVESNLSYELILSVIKVESNFDSNARSNTNDYGLLQLNQRNHKWLAEEVGIKNVNPLNPYQNVSMGVFYLSYLRDYYVDRGCSDEEVFKRVILSFHYGIEGSKKVKNIENDTYLKKVREAKKEIEESLVQG